jgi:polyisoprenoid-binding protein YceI
VAGHDHFSRFGAVHQALPQPIDKEKKMKSLFRVFTIIILLASPALAKDWQLDANHSALRFGVKHIFSTVYGSFSDYGGTIRFDPKALDKSEFNFTVQVKSIDTGNGKRDGHLRSKDFFDAGTFPAMTFKSSKITHIEGNNYKMTGTMTLKKTSKEMEIPFVYHGTAPSPFDKSKMVAGFDTEFDIDRLAFGVGSGKFHKMGVVGKDVRVTISVEALGSK